MADTKKGKRPSFESKRCPNCSIDLPLDSLRCPGCDTKIRGVDQFGRAKPPIDWKAYAVCIVSWLLFGFFVWWGFFSDY